MEDEREGIGNRVAAYRSGEDPDLSRLLASLWEVLYARLPALTDSRHKADQHRILEDYLVELGLPRSAELQYVAGPVLWYAREKGVLPPAKTDDGPRESWTLDAARYETGKRSLQEGLTAYSDWMRDALRGILSEQQ